MIYLYSDGTTGNICPVGNYCPEGSTSPTPCAATTYMNHTGGAVCYSCPQGYYCTSGDRADPCPQGYYCPPGTGSGYLPCPIGNYLICFHILRSQLILWWMVTNVLVLRKNTVVCEVVNF